MTGPGPTSQRPNSPDGGVEDTAPAPSVGVDPAVVSAPLITTLVDATGLVIYLLIAKALLGL